MRSLDFAGGPRIGVSGANASAFYARHWLRQIGLEAAPLDEIEAPSAVIIAGNPGDNPDKCPDSCLDSGRPEAITRPEGVTQIVLWDFQTDKCGNGLHAAAAAGVSWVIGHADGPPLALPIDIPEKWCGLVGANLAIGALLEANLQGRPGTRRVDISAADTLRSFADQNSGNHAEIDRGWHRNGSTAVEHGGIYPQGYFACGDGHVGLVGRSRRDWSAIRDVIGRPAWSNEERFDDPFLLAADADEADGLLAEALAGFDRDELLKRAIHHGAPVAPVYAADELVGRNVVRPGFFAEDGSANLPFEIVSRAG